MAHKSNRNLKVDEDVEGLLGKLADTPARDPQAQAQGRARFLAQAKSLVPTGTVVPAVSREEEVRHIGWNTIHFFERILKSMKIQTKLSALAAVVVVAVVAVFVASNVTTVSAQQILDRAAQAQSTPAPSQGILHTRIQIFENHKAVAQASAGTTTIDEDYFDLATGYNRYVTRDLAGKILEIGSYDGSFTYSSGGAAGRADLKVTRAPLSPDDKRKYDSKQGASYYDPSANAKALFEDFRKNPRVRVEAKKTWTDGSTVYVLVDDNYQSQKGTDTPTFTGSMRMVFDAKTYELVESQTSVRKDGKDVVIDEVQWLTDEILPAGSPVAWDLSDLKGVKIVDAPQNQTSAQSDPGFSTLTQADLATHTKDFYVLKNIPAGYAQEIVAANGQPKDQAFTFEIHYKNPDGNTFEMQAVGQMDPGFVESSFTDGSYKAVSGLVLHYSTGGKNGVAGMLVATNGESFLLDSTLPREQVQALVEDLVQGK